MDALTTESPKKPVSPPLTPTQKQAETDRIARWQAEQAARAAHIRAQQHARLAQQPNTDTFTQQWQRLKDWTCN